MNNIFKKIACFSLAASMLVSSQCIAVQADDTETTPLHSEFAAFYPNKVRISEVMTKNSASNITSYGDCSDWFELHNYSDKAIEITGWVVEAENGSFTFPTCFIKANSYIVVWADEKETVGNELHTGFTLSDKSVLSLYSSEMESVDSIIIPSMKADRSFCVNEYGEYSSTSFITPGFANNDRGYIDYMESIPNDGVLSINEVVVGNTSTYNTYKGNPPDWVEIVNNSDSAIDLSEYYLSDKDSDLYKWNFPSKTLNPGSYIVVYCDKDDCVDDSGYFHTNFSLSMNSDRLYISNADGIVDHMYIHDVPVNGSMGRLDDFNGFFYLSNPTPWESNHSSGYRFVSTPATLVTSEGVFNNVDSVPVELTGSGTIYYTTDGSVPTVNSQVYTEPFAVNKTTVVRAINVEPDRYPSAVSTYSYIVNENHVLPVVSLVTDNHAEYYNMYRGCNKYMEIPGVFTLFELDGRSVTNRCGIVLSGAGTVYSMPKKSMSMLFRGKYGDGELNYDVFGTGQTRYSALTVRAGEAFCTSVIRSDLFQDLALQIENNASITQHSKHCIVYVDGEYFGMMTLKEKFTEEYFADIIGVKDPDTVTIIKYPVQLNSSFYTDVIQYCRENDMSTQENFDYFCSVVNINSFIDWLLVEGYSANPDIGDNMRLMLSTETGQWYFALYDLDWAYQTTDTCFTNLMYGSEYNSLQLKHILEPLLKNTTFVDMVATRYAEIWNTVLSNENVLSMLDDYQVLLEDEIARDRDEWGNSKEVWEIHMDRLRNFIKDNDVQNAALKKLCSFLNLSDEQINYYFG